ncbi:hypothetical protein KKI23_04290 [Patescibacteria group bacterium]|nr:hypothetical protein [Patescibacteria group bacterium]
MLGYWSIFFHIYQPPNWSKVIIDQVVKESYRPILQILKRRPNLKITLNINGSLTEQLVKYKYQDVINDIIDLAAKRQIEFTDSAQYHVILALLPSDEIKRQIKLNRETNKKYFGPVFNPEGFFIPEMCYGKKLAGILDKLGYKWLILDEIAHHGKLGEISFDQKYKIKGTGLNVIFRNRMISDLFHTKEISTKNDFMGRLKKDQRSQHYLITAFDGENLGHHNPGMDKTFANIVDAGNFKTLTVTELIHHYQKQSIVDPLASSWASWEDNFADNIAYPLWQNPDNRIHRLQWRLTYLVLKTFKNSHQDKGQPQARLLLDKALMSDQYWWASGCPWWEPKIIIQGAQNLIKILYVLQKVPASKREEAEKILIDIKKMIVFVTKTGLINQIRKNYLHKEVFSRVFSGKVVK